MLRTYLPTSVAMALTMCGLANGQAVQQTQPYVISHSGVETATGGSANMLDQAIAGCLLLGNHEEIALAEFADGRAKQGEVQEFAKMLAKEHKQAVAKLEKIAPTHAAAAKHLDSQNGKDANAASTNVAASGMEQGLGERIFAMESRATSECLKLTKKELEKMKDADFDRAYLGSQVGAHIGMLAKLRAAKEFASPQLKSAIVEAETMVEKHLSQAQELCEQVGKKDQNRQARNDASRR